MSISPKDALKAAIAREERLLEKLETEQQQARERLRELRSTVTGSEAASSLPMMVRETTVAARAWPALGPVTPAEKVALFRSLFRGREDVFPKLWVNPKAEKKGYAPACRNEWERGICDKPRIKCSECPNQAFIPVTDRIVFDHLIY